MSFLSNNGKSQLLLQAEFCSHFRNITEYINSNETGNPDLFVFITHLESQVGHDQQSIGVSWKGSVCYNNDWNIDMGVANGKGYRVGINSWVTSDLACAEVSSRDVVRFSNPGGGGLNETLNSSPPANDISMY